MPGTGGSSPTGHGRGRSSPEGFPSLDDGNDEQQPEQPERLQYHQPGGWNPGSSPGNPSGLLGISVSLPNLRLLGGEGAAGRKQAYRGPKGK